MRWREIPFLFEVASSRLLAIASVPDHPARLAVAIVVGGPQYRVGSHRQFVLLARSLADAGVACMRFDYRGMGDSEGPRIAFTEIDADLRAALDAFAEQVPGVERVVLWGLCDGATASALYAPRDPRVAGLALFNPWVRTEAGTARVFLRHYYARRLFDPGFWHKLLRGRVGGRAALRDLRRNVTEVRSRSGVADADLPQRFGAAIMRAPGPVLVGLSGNDFVAGEFKDAIGTRPVLASALDDARVTTIEFAGVDHTFSRAEWRDACAEATLAWLREQFASWLEPASGDAQILSEIG